MRLHTIALLEWLLGKLQPRATAVDGYTYRIAWEPVAGEYLATCDELPSLSWMAPSHALALQGLVALVAAVRTDMDNEGEIAPPAKIQRDPRVNVPSASVAVEPQPTPSISRVSMAHIVRQDLAQMPGRARAMAEIHRAHCCAIHGCLRPGSRCSAVEGLEPYFGCKQCEENVHSGIAAP